jgi:hypothetical protein
MKKILGIAVAIIVGLVVLAGYFFQPQLSPILALVFEWGLVLIGVAGLIGIGHLLAMHMRKIVRWEKRSFFSIIVLIAFLFAMIAGILLTPQNALYRNLVLNVQIPVETSLLAILAVTLFYAGLRLIRVRGWTPMSIAFLASAIFSLILDLGIIQTGGGTIASAVLAFFERLPLVGARGILLGMALGGLVVGLRVLLAIDRPYGE